MRVVVPHALSTKIEFKDMDGNFKTGLSLFLKDGMVFGIKPSLSISSINLSFPIVLSNGLGKSSFPLKVAGGIFALVSLLFYNWSEQPEPGEEEKRLDRYKDLCKQWNRSKKITFQDHRLSILLAYGWDSSVQSPEKKLEEIYSRICKSLKRGESLPTLADTISKEIEGQIPTVYNITEEISSMIVMDSVKIKLNDSSSSLLSSVPRVSPDNKLKSAVVYSLDSKLYFKIFDSVILIGRKA